MDFTGFHRTLARHPGRHLLAGVAIALIAGSCGPAYIAPPVTRELVNLSQSPAPLLERGRIIHEAKCAKCHPFENPARHSEDDLTRRILPEMARKSKLPPADEQAVLEYLLAARRLPPPSDTPPP